MSTATLSSPRTTNSNDQGELYCIAVPATRSAVRVARESVQAILRPYPELIDDACVCISDAIAFTLAEMPEHPTVTVTVWFRRAYVAFVIEDGDGPSHALYHLTPKNIADAPMLAITRQTAIYLGVCRVWDGHRRATRVYLELPIEGQVPA
ncbi:hypothetical protein [Streptomyces sp. C36]|uniref:hypothetical protein n=1 Tax=Streptomyces sp. C36 TaxID=3237122 RepID=UPI0034C6890B